MLQKAIFQFLVLVALFFGTWFGLQQINWMKVLRIEQNKKTLEQKLGDQFWDFYSKTETEVRSPFVVKAIDSLVTRLCTSNNLDRSKIKVHILEKDEINAFALPNDHLVVYTGLIAAAENEAELLGVLGHEIAHIEKSHVMKKLSKEIGLSVLVSMSAGSAGGEVVKKALKLLSSTAYDRDLEREADQTSVEYLLKAKVNPEPLAQFFFRLAEKEKDTPEQAYWISTHPDSKERAIAIINFIKDKPDTNYTHILSDKDWAKLKIRYPISSINHPLSEYEDNAEIDTAIGKND